VLALAATMLAASGCGGATKSTSQRAAPARTESSTATESSSRTGPLTRAELIAAADLICRRVNAKHAATTFSSRASLARLLPMLAAYQQEADSAMRKLTPPASMAKSWKEMVADATTFTTAMAKLGEYVKANNVKGGYSVSHAGARANERLLAIAKREGFTDCARNS
jgi:hypothetical protein